jgi:hypothetical protein
MSFFVAIDDDDDPTSLLEYGYVPDPQETLP